MLALGLVTDPAPSQFNGNVANVTVTGVADSLLAPAIAALVGRRCQTRQRSHLPPVAKLPPAKELSYQHPTPISINAPQHRELMHLVQVRTLLLFVRALSLFHCAPAFAFQSLDLLLHKQHMLPLPASSGSLRPQAAPCRSTTGSPRVVRLKGPYETPTGSPGSPATPGSDSSSASFPSSDCAALDATAARPPPRAKELAPHSRPCALRTRSGSTLSVASAHPIRAMWTLRG